MNFTNLDVKAVASQLQSATAFDLIDVRTAGEYHSGHAAGARSVPLDRLDAKALLASRQGPADQPIYVICKSGNRSRTACEKLAAAGIGNLVNVSGGTEGWKHAGLPIEGATRRVLPLDRQVQSTAGTICLAGAILGTWMNPWFYLLSAMVGFGLLVAGLTGFCPMAILLARMPWNQHSKAPCACGTSSCCSSVAAHY
jgi:rhodanese-related sulfurtransferase